MESLRRIIPIVLAAALLILAVLTWGSVGSAVCTYCLIMMGAAILVKRFLIDRDEDEFEME